MTAALLLAASRFVLAERGGRTLFEGRDGKPFWSFGVCVVDRGTPAPAFDPKNPSYSADRSYTSADAWARDTAERLQRWGFNTVGAWSDDANLLQVSAPNLRFMPTLSIGAAAGAPWRDLWDPATVATMDAVAAKGIALRRGDPRVVGYFSDNELGWWNAALFEWGFKAGPRSRTRLVALLRARYRGRWSALLRDFDPDGAKDFDGLAQKGRLYLRSGGSGMAAVQAWTGVVADRYYTLCRYMIKRHDPGALYLGDRYISNFYPEVARAAGRHCDVVSTNLNADWNDGTFAPFYLPTLHRLTRRPLLVSEYYVAAMENRSGNRNDSSGFPVVATQAERARVFRRSTESLLRTPYVVGAHWFQYYDEPKNGRGDGENYDMGLVDTGNRPYELLVQASRSIGLTAPLKPASARSHEIPFIAPTAAGDLAHWPRDRACVPPAGKAERGDLYAVREGESLLLAFYWNEDRFGEAFYRSGHVPEEDRARVRIQVPDGTTVEARLGDSRMPTVRGGGCVAHHDGVRNTAILRLPWPHRAGSVRVEMETRARAYRMRWRIAVR